MTPQPEFSMNLPEKEGEKVKAWCKCGTECDCIIKIYSNQTRHAHGICPKCGQDGAKSQRLAPSLEELKHRLLWIRTMVLSMSKGVDQEEAVAMIERMVDALSDEVNND